MKIIMHTWKNIFVILILKSSVGFAVDCPLPILISGDGKESFNFNNHTSFGIRLLPAKVTSRVASSSSGRVGLRIAPRHHILLTLQHHDTNITKHPINIAINEMEPWIFKVMLGEEEGTWVNLSESPPIDEWIFVSILQCVGSVNVTLEWGGRQCYTIKLNATMPSEGLVLKAGTASPLNTNYEVSWNCPPGGVCMLGSLRCLLLIPIIVSVVLLMAIFAAVVWKLNLIHYGPVHARKPRMTASRKFHATPGFTTTQNPVFGGRKWNSIRVSDNAHIVYPMNSQCPPDGTSYQRYDDLN